MKRSKVIQNTAGYEQDFYAWTVEQAKLLRSGELSQIDATNVAEEIESLGRQDRRELTVRLEALIIELLKWRVEAGARCGNWQSQISRQRFEIEQIIDDSPSLRRYAAEQLAVSYAAARKRVIEDQQLLHANLAAQCPYSLDEILSDAIFAVD